MNIAAMSQKKLLKLATILYLSMGLMAKNGWKHIILASIKMTPL
jgi:hypothetical protein